jgi:hypothetical protein
VKGAREAGVSGGGWGRGAGCLPGAYAHYVARAAVRCEVPCSSAMLPLDPDVSIGLDLLLVSCVRQGSRCARPPSRAQRWTADIVEGVGTS